MTIKHRIFGAAVGTLAAGLLLASPADASTPPSTEPLTEEQVAVHVSEAVRAEGLEIPPDPAFMICEPLSPVGTGQQDYLARGASWLCFVTFVLTLDDGVEMRGAFEVAVWPNGETETHELLRN